MNRELACRLRDCLEFNWVDGMLLLDPPNSPRRVDFALALELNHLRGQVAVEAYPDLDDWPTVGALYGMLDELSAERPAKLGGRAAGRWCWAVCYPVGYPHVIHYGATAGEALSLCLMTVWKALREPSSE